VTGDRHASVANFTGFAVYEELFKLGGLLWSVDQDFPHPFCWLRLKVI
jgi:hypothetical protein